MRTLSLIQLGYHGMPLTELLEGTTRLSPVDA